LCHYGNAEKFRKISVQFEMQVGNPSGKEGNDVRIRRSEEGSMINRNTLL